MSIVHMCCTCCRSATLLPNKICTIHVLPLCANTQCIHHLHLRKPLLLHNKQRPTWNSQLEAWVLNFNGRVRIPSKKNFLAAPERGNLAMESEFGEGAVLLRHGKMSKARYIQCLHSGHYWSVLALYSSTQSLLALLIAVLHTAA
jgi:Tub family